MPFIDLLFCYRNSFSPKVDKNLLHINTERIDVLSLPRSTYNQILTQLQNYLSVSREILFSNVYLCFRACVGITISRFLLLALDRVGRFPC